MPLQRRNRAAFKAMLPQLGLIGVRGVTMSIQITSNALLPDGRSRLLGTTGIGHTRRRPAIAGDIEKQRIGKPKRWRTRLSKIAIRQVVQCQIAIGVQACR